ncbi:hypothetical protein L1887_34065 [Cichorium endivia]|nr:hypothetical protein L1887_34065 [Cichorium endivia]
MDQEQINLIDMFSEERNRRENLEQTLRNKLKEARDTIEDLHRKVNVLKSNGVIRDGGKVGIHVLGSLRSNPGGGGGGGMRKGFRGTQVLGSLGLNGGGDGGGRGLVEGMLGIQVLGSPKLNIGGLENGGKFGGGYGKEGGCGGADGKGASGGNWKGGNEGNGGN